MAASMLSRHTARKAFTVSALGVAGSAEVQERRVANPTAYAVKSSKNKVLHAAYGAVAPVLPPGEV